MERQLRQCGSALHVFGHTHLPMDLARDGVRYVQVRISHAACPLKVDLACPALPFTVHWLPGA